MFQGREGIAIVGESGLGLGDGRASVGDHRIEGGGIGVQSLNVGNVGGDGADCGAEAVTYGVQIGLGGEDRIGLVIRHGQRSLRRVQRAQRSSSVRLGRGVGCVQGGASRGEQRRGLLGIVLEGGEHLSGVDAGDALQLSLGSLQVAQFLGEAFARLRDVGGQRRLLCAPGRDGGLSGAQRIHVRREITHHALGELCLRGGRGGIGHLWLRVEGASDGGLCGLQQALELVGSRPAELGLREV